MSVSLSKLSQAKEGFRDKMKIYHPDVYKGTSDASRITARLLLAYDIIKDEVRTHSVNIQ